LNRVQPEAIWEGVIQEDSSWCYVDKEDLKQKMRYVLNNYDEVKQKAKELKDYLVKEFTSQKKNEEFVESILSVIPSLSMSNDEIDQWLNDINLDLVEVE
jgi:spore maturation protein CgeB